MFNVLKKYFVISAFLMSTALSAQPLHIVYHPNYNITFYGIPKIIQLHSFNGEKYGEIHEAIKNIPTIVTHTPARPISDRELLAIHSPQYLQNLKKSITVAHIAEIAPLQYVPNFILQRALLNPIKWATQGTLDALSLALEHGSAINLGGGYHHAKANKGEGFCFYSDIALAVKKFHATNPSKKVMIIDLDAHQGNGHESIFFNNKDVVIFDVYNMDMYPQETDLYPTIKHNFPLRSAKLPTRCHTNPTAPALEGDINGARYINFLQDKIANAIATEKPGVIIYVAGSDILDNDPLGRLNVNKQAIIERDEIVFKNALQYHIPIIMLLAGGYTKESSDVVSSSIVNLQQKFFR